MMSCSAYLLLGVPDACHAMVQTVMTSVYGVTFMGARDQISNRYAGCFGFALHGLT